LCCPWNKFAQPSAEADFAPRHGLDDVDLTELFSWSESKWLERMAGSAIRRIGYDCWLRNIAVALGNAKTTVEVVGALKSRLDHDSDMVIEHIEWSLARHKEKQNV
jgi:epoxyqueuosine reductase